jgi:hypothetical protein
MAATVSGLDERVFVVSASFLDDPQFADTRFERRRIDRGLSTYSTEQIAEEALFLVRNIGHLDRRVRVEGPAEAMIMESPRGVSQPVQGWFKPPS